MYEKLLEWSVDALKQALGAASDHEIAVVMEAVKVKNQLVIKRFDIAHNACEQILQLQFTLEKSLSDFQKDYKTPKNKSAPDSYAGKLKREFHPEFYRQYRNIRSQFDTTTDLLSGYSMALSDWLHFNKFEEILAESECETVSDVTRIYRMYWNFVSSTLRRLLRVTSNDLRFWLTDDPYIQYSVEWARREDIPALKKFFVEDAQGKDIFYTSLESTEKVIEFWRGIQQNA